MSEPVAPYCYEYWWMDARGEWWERRTEKHLPAEAARVRDIVPLYTHPPSERVLDRMRGVLTIIEQAEDKAQRDSANREWAEWMRHQYEGEVRAYGYATKLIRDAIAAEGLKEGG